MQGAWRTIQARRQSWVRPLLCILVFLSVGTGLVGCFTQITAPKAVVDIQPVEKPFLWQVKNGGKSSWLFGTIHLGVDAERELPKQVWDAFNASECFVMEANPAEITMSEVASMATLPRGQKLSDLVGVSVFRALVSKVRGTLPESLLERSQPWFVSLLLLRSGYENTISMDAAMLARARQSGKQVFFLEDWRDAMKEYAAIVNADDLKEMLANEGKLEKDLNDLIEAYRSGQEEKLAGILDRVYGSTKDGRQKMHRLIEGRNHKWMPVLLEALRGRGCFVAVGVGHYLGNESLRSLLDARGWMIL